MKERLVKELDQIKNDPSIFLNFLKANYPFFHNSNFFRRDLQYGIKKFMEKKDINISILESEELTDSISKYFEEKEIFIRVNSMAWKINMPEFVTQVPGDPL